MRHLVFFLLLLTIFLLHPGIERRARAGNPTFFALNYTSGSGGGSNPIAYNNLPMRVQFNRGTTGTTAARTSLLNKNTWTGNLLVVVATSTNTADTLSVSDSQGNTFASVNSTTRASLGKIQMFYAQNIIGGPDTVTCSSTSSAAVDCTVAEYKNMASASALDASAVANNSTNSSAVTVTTTQARDVLIKATYVATAYGASYPLDANMWGLLSGVKTEYEDRVAPTAQAYTTTDSLSAAQNWITIGAAFKVAAGNNYDQGMYVIGGWDSSTGTTFGNVLRSDDFGENWMRLSTLPAPREDHCTLSYNNALWVIGGADGSAVTSTVYKSNDAGVTWSSVGNLPAVRDSMGCVVYNNKMWVFGGTVDDTVSGVANTVWSSTDGVTWTSVGTIPTAVVIQGQATVYNNKIFYVEGRDVTNNVSGLVRWSTDGITWSTAGTSAIPNNFYENAGLVAHNGLMWLIGGNDGGSPWANVYTCGDPCASWTAKASLPEADNSFAAISLNGKLVKAPGQYGNLALNTSDGASWKTVADLSASPNIHRYAFSYGTVGPDGSASTCYTDDTGLVQYVDWGGSNGSASATLPGPQAAGDTNIVFITWQATSGSVTSVTDTGGNTYTAAGGITRSTSYSQQVFYASNIAAAAAGANTINVTTTGTGASNIWVHPDEYRGLATANPVDGTPSGSSGVSTGTSSGTVTTTNSCDLLVSRVWYGGSGTSTDSRFSVSDTFGSDLVQTRVVTSPGTYNATSTQDSSLEWINQLVAFKKTSSQITPTIHLVQKDQFQNNATYLITHFLAGQIAGDLNVVVVGFNDVTHTVTGISDTAGNTYTLVAGPIRGSSSTQYIYYAKNILASSGNAVTVNFNASVSGGSMLSLEFAGLSTTAPLDVTASASGSSISPNSGNVTTTSANELVLGFLYNGNAKPSTGSGYSFLYYNNMNGGGEAMLGEMKTVSSTGTYNATAALDNSQPWVMSIVTFK